MYLTIMLIALAWGWTLLYQNQAGQADSEKLDAEIEGRNKSRSN